MPANKSKSVPLSAAAQRRTHESAKQVINHAIDLLASGVPLTNIDIHSAAIPNPVSGGRTMLDAQKFRINWYHLDRKALTKIARLVVERNWFARPVHQLNKAIYGAGFRFKDKEARKWAADGSFPFQSVHDDLLDEWLVSDSVVAFWRKSPEAGKLPMIHVPDMNNVEYSVTGGIPQIKVTIAADRKIKEELKEKIGLRMWNAIKKGEPLTIIKGIDEDFEFEILKSGKSTSPIQPPAITGILDDLDYIEAVRVGDWNGAYSRREIIRHTKKGYGVSSGPNAGTTRNNAKYKEIQAILTAMKSILGKTDVATNFDQEIAWLMFDPKFFDPKMLESALQRLIFWGGLPAILLLKTDSQITGLSGFLHDRVRTQVEGFRQRFGPFLAAIFNSQGFKHNFPDAPDLTPAWSVKSLYTNDGLSKLATLLHTYGIAAPPNIRAMFDIDDEEESSAMLKAHENRKAYTPPFEPRQGLIPGLFPDDFPEDSTASGKNPQSLPGSPGRPAAE